MNIGIPREVKDHEFRVAMTPGGVHALVVDGHAVRVESGAGEGSGFSDAEYQAAGAEIVTCDAAWKGSDLLLKVKEPQEAEFGFLRPGLVLFTYLHLAAEAGLAQILVDRKVTGIGYETVRLPDGTLPLLVPMSEVAGRMSVQVAAHYLEKMQGGRGKLLGGVHGVLASDVAIVGGGVVGTQAAMVAVGMGARVTILDARPARLRYLNEIMHGRVVTVGANPRSLAEAIRQADVVIGAVLIPGAKAPRLVTREMIRSMTPGSVAVDVAIDQGGCFETSRPTSHSHPVYVEEGVIHYCVTNIPGAVPRTSTDALAQATLPYVRALADRSLEAALRADPALAQGVNTLGGHITHAGVAAALGRSCTPLDGLIGKRRG